MWGPTAQTARTFNSTATSQTVTGLTNGTTYTFKVAAKNGNGTGPQSVASGPVTVGAPVAPTNVSAVPGNGSAVVSWTAPASNNGSAVTGYVVTPYVGTTAQTATTFNSTATSQTVTGLTNGTTYTFKVAAKNGNGTGPQSAASPPTSTANRVGVSRSSIDFGTVSVGQPVSTPLTLTNLGGASDPSITINGLTVSGADSNQFSAAVPRVDPSGAVVTGPPVTLAPGASVTLTVWYAAAAGTRSAALTIGSTAANSSLTVPMSGSSPGSAVGFGKSTLTGTASGVNADVVKFGPDGRLYVAEFSGTIHAYTIARTAANNYSVTATETINLIRQIPNHDDDGTVNSAVTTRIITGMLVAGTPAAPQLYVTSSDPRIGGGGSGTQTNLDTNSSMVSRLDRNGATWTRTDLVRGLPRSEENHSANGLALDPATNTLYVAQGGNTNMGAPSHNFNFLPEYAYSAAILKVDLTAIGNTTYDLPTLADDHLPNPDGPVRRGFRSTPGEDRRRQSRPGLRAGIPQPVRRRHHPSGQDVHGRQRRERRMG